MVELSELWFLGMILAAFAGGAFGSAVGPLPAFIFTGFMVIAGEVANIMNADLVEMLDMQTGLVKANAITGSIGFGPVFGPHISFAAGTAATAFAARKGYMDTGFPFHEAKNILHAHGPRPDVMVVGGIFGILGYWITTLSAAFSMPWDPIAMGVVLSAVVHRVVFRYPLIGDRTSGLLNMKPFGDGERRPKRNPKDDGEKERFVVEPWLPHQYKWPDVTILGFVVGILAAFVTYKTGSVFLPFGISAATLLFLNCGVANIPVTHHMSLVASTAIVAASGGAYAESSLSVMLLLGGGFGMLAALSGELIQRIFFAHSDTHLDPPAAAIVVGTFIIALLALGGVFASSAWVPTP